MKIKDMFRHIDEVAQETAELPYLSLKNLDISLQVDRHGKLYSQVSPARQQGQTRIAYENLWGELSRDMFAQAKSQIRELRNLFTCRLIQASIEMQKDLLQKQLSGPISFWRSDSGWLSPLVHPESWDRRSRLYFVDAFETDRKTIDSFCCRKNLWEMPEEYQADFLKNCWELYVVNLSESVLYTGDPPPVADSEVMAEMLLTQVQRPGERPWMLH